MALFVLLPMLSLGAMSFAIGAVTRQAVLVFALPVAILLANLFFLWSFAPEWLPHWGNRVLQAVDITGFRWLNETWLKVDRGAAFYNSNPLSLDGLMAAQRLLVPATGVAALALAAWREQARMRAPYEVPEAARRRDGLVSV